MKTVRIYYAGIPAKNTKREKRDVLTNFHLGVGAGGHSTEVKTMSWQPADLAVIQGWVHANSGNTPHLNFRKQIIQNQHAIGKHTLAIDSNLFLYKDPKNIKTYLRFSLDDIFPTTGNYFTDNVDPTRWQQIKQDIGLELQPWRIQGNHILICLQRNGGWSMGNLDVMQWCNNTIKEISKFSNRPIVIRSHPGDKNAKNYLRINHPNVTISTNTNILDDFKNAWAVVTYNSSPGVAGAIEGIPVFVTDPNPKISQAFEVANCALKDIETPVMPDRQQWLNDYAHTEWTIQEISNGLPLKYLTEHL
jgi:hypothetical protein